MATLYELKTFNGSTFRVIVNNESQYERLKASAEKFTTDKENDDAFCSFECIAKGINSINEFEELMEESLKC